jgi:hypothetical protein
MFFGHEINIYYPTYLLFEFYVLLYTCSRKNFGAKTLRSTNLSPHKRLILQYCTSNLGPSLKSIKSVILNPPNKSSQRIHPEDRLSRSPESEKDKIFRTKCLWEQRYVGRNVMATQRNNVRSTRNIWGIHLFNYFQLFNPIKIGNTLRMTRLMSPWG